MRVELEALPLRRRREAALKTSAPPPRLWCLAPRPAASAASAAMLAASETGRGQELRCPSESASGFRGIEADPGTKRDRPPARDDRHAPPTSAGAARASLGPAGVNRAADRRTHRHLSGRLVGLAEEEPRHGC